jgi:hypothetical protein
VVTAQLLSFKTTGVFGASGYDFGTPNLRSAVGSVWKALGHQRDELGGVMLDHALIGLTAGGGTAVESEVAAFRDALLDALDELDDVEGYGQPATPLVRDAALVLCRALNALAVAA